MLVVFAVHGISEAFGFATWLYDVLLTLLFLATFPLFLKRRGYWVAALVFGVPTVVANWTGYALPGLPERPLAITFHLLAAAFLSLSVAVILTSIQEANAITFDSLAGAFAGYLIAGTVFGHLFAGLEWLAPGSFNFAPHLASQGGQRLPPHLLLNYFSFVTLTTVGYGDITPVTQAARTLACLEAVVGQFYIAVVMAELIGLRVSQPRGGDGPQPGPP
jgi:hypothetical protein